GCGRIHGVWPSGMKIRPCFSHRNMSGLHISARDVPLARGIPLVDAPGLGIPADAGSHRHQGPLPEAESVADGRVDPQETIGLDRAMTTQDDVGGEHHMICDGAMMADVV